MKNVKQLLFIFALMLMINLSSAFLFSCGKNDGVKYTTSGNGQVESVKINGEKYFMATADQWHEFVGWFDGNRKINENPKLKITKKTPKKLEARFVTTARLSFDRILNGLYNAYINGISQEGEYFNIISNLKIAREDDLTTYSFGGHLNFNEKGNQLFLKSESKNNNYAIVYDDDLDNGFAYVDYDGEKSVFEDLGILSNVLKSLPDPSKDSWNIENLLNNKTLFYQFEQYFGYTNATGIVESVINDKQKSTFVINFTKLLSTLKTNYPNFEEDSFLKDLTEILTGNYTDSSFPKISITANIEFDNEQKQQIKNMQFLFDISKDYLLKFGDKTIVVSKGKINVEVNDLNYAYCTTPLNYDDDLSLFPKPEHNLLNFQLIGDLTFATDEMEENPYQDIYRVEMNADINPFALISYNKDGKGYENIEWEKLGFLSLSIILIPAENEADCLSQYERHKGSTEYLNILIDTKRYGANMFMRASFYNPNTLLTTSYFFNNSFYLPELMKYYHSSEVSTYQNEKTDNSSFANNIIKTLIDICINFDKTDINGSFYNIFLKYFDKNGLLSENLTLSEEGIILQTKNIRQFIREKESDVGLLFLGYPIKSDTYILGKDEITKIVLNFDKFSQGIIKKDINGFYYDSQGNNIVDVFNEKYQTVSKIDKISYFDDKNMTIDEISSLNGQVVEVDSFTLSNGEKVNLYYSISGKNEVLKMKILKQNILKVENNVAKVRFIMAVDSPFNKPNYLNTSLSEVLLKHLNFPYGLMTYECEFELNN